MPFISRFDAPLVALAVMLLLAVYTLPVQAESPSEAQVRAWSETYFKRYAARADWPGFMDQFAEDLDFLDPIAGIALESRATFEQFYFWPDPAFSKHPEYPRTLVLEELIVQDNRGIGAGYFTPFRYNGTTFGDREPMRFTIWLEWDADGKIVAQTDWIAYPPALIQAMYCAVESPSAGGE